MPGQLKKIRTHTDRTIKGQLRRQQRRVPHYRSCAHTESGISPPRTHEWRNIVHRTPTGLPKIASTEFPRSLN